MGHAALKHHDLYRISTQIRPIDEMGVSWYIHPMRYAAKTDQNHAEIAAALRAAGATVCDLSRVGGGCPDLLVGGHGINYLLEIKDGKKPPSKRMLNGIQKEWHVRWRGSVSIVTSVDDALAAIGVARK